MYPLSYSVLASLVRLMSCVQAAVLQWRLSSSPHHHPVLLQPWPQPGLKRRWRYGATHSLPNLASDWSWLGVQASRAPTAPVAHTGTPARLCVTPTFLARYQ